MTIERLDEVRRLIEQLPGTSERQFDSGAKRYYIGQRLFAYESTDLSRLVLAIDDREWEALQLAPDPHREPLPPASSRQRARFIAVSLAGVDLPDLLLAVRDAWDTCAPRELRSTLHDVGDDT